MKSTFSRTLFPAILVILLAIFLVGTSFQALVRDYLEKQALDSLENDADAISQLALAYYHEGAMSSDAFLVNLTIASQISDANAVISGPEGQLLICSDSPLGCIHQGWNINQDYFNQVVEKGCVKSTGKVQGLYDDNRFVVSVPITATDGSCAGIVTVSSPMQETLQVLRRMGDIYMSVSLLVMVIAVAFMVFYAKKQSIPLRVMAKAARAFGHGNLDARVHVEDSAPEEVRELALSFNNMASSLQKSEYQRQEFVANVSHELKTPMTTISGMVDGILDGTIPQEKQRHYLQVVSDETKRLSRLVRSMLDISRMQDRDIPDERKTRFDVCECAGQVLITFEQKVTQKALKMQVEMPEYPVYTRADMDAITQVIYNLLDNAVKFCPAHCTMGLRLQLSDTNIYVSVFNEGDTIPPEELPLVFDRFHKLDKSRSVNRDGWGLGLYIVKTLVCSHGEDISVTSKDGRTEFTFTLPLVN